MTDKTEPLYNPTFLRVYSQVEPQKEYTVKELERLTGCSGNAIRNNARNWRQLGILSTKRETHQGRLKPVYRFNPKIVRVTQRLFRYVERLDDQQ